MDRPTLWVSATDRCRVELPAWRAALGARVDVCNVDAYSSDPGVRAATPCVVLGGALVADLPAVLAYLDRASGEP